MTLVIIITKEENTFEFTVSDDVNGKVSNLILGVQIGLEGNQIFFSSRFFFTYEKLVKRDLCGTFT